MLPPAILNGAGGLEPAWPRSRFAAPLVKRIEAMGGAKWMLLTPRDDVADRDRFAQHFGLTRVLHERDAPVPGGPIERMLAGDDPVTCCASWTGCARPSGRAPARRQRQ